MGDFALADGLLQRRQYDAALGTFEERVVVPVGGLRSFFFVGRKYRLDMRRSLMLYMHDSESMGAHASARDTLSKLAAFCWWPRMDRHVSQWVAQCSVCRLTKPAKALTASQRSEGL